MPTKFICPLIEEGAVAFMTADGTIHIEGDPEYLLETPGATRQDVIVQICGSCIFHLSRCSPVAPESSDDWQISKGSTSLQNYVYGINRRL